MKALILSLTLLTACGLRGSENEDRTDASVDTGNSAAAWWLEYPEPPDPNWETLPLTEERYLNVLPEVACLNRDFQGTPEEKMAILSRVYFFHKTTAEHVANFGTRVNANPDTAQRIGAILAKAVQRCGSP